MSENTPPGPGEDPTEIHRPVGPTDDELDATRMQPTVPPFDPYAGDPTVAARPVVSETRRVTQGVPEERRGLLAPLITVALLCTLLGLGLGYLLFSDSGDSEAPPEVTTTLAPVTTVTTTEAPTTTAPATTSTTSRKGTTTTRRSTTEATNSQGQTAGQATTTR